MVAPVLMCDLCHEPAMNVKPISTRRCAASIDRYRVLPTIVFER